MQTKIPDFEIRFAQPSDVPILLELIEELAEYEKLTHEVVATEEILHASLFGDKKVAEAILGYYQGKPVSFAVFFANMSTFLGRSGIYLEDLYVKPEMRGQGIGKAMLSSVAKLAAERNCGRLEWSVLDWNQPAIAFYQKLGAVPMSEWTVFRLTGQALTDLSQEFERS
ncbi:GNAT family N-acetyltransferase [Merismopedia glauca CCAP 1448/3]|uniref:GNAT family N-acetyltransferase n=1 Tax=Merismopedia glauca CCAP 1448/3 TaxID=1296344 RepID=A0A2T1C5W3_9CYAN|nr:GNAT family N-acetyltransferase [Merismopedia glauca CCAP 1448/3]